MKNFKLYLLTALAALFGLYTYAWFLGANKLETALLDQVKILEEKGYNIAYGDLQVTGFPLGIHLEVEGAVLEAPAPIAASLSIVGTLHGHASFMDPTHVTFKAEQGVEVTTSLLGDGHNTVLKSAALRATMPLPNPLKDFKLTFYHPHIGAIDVTADTLTLGLKLHENDRALDIYAFEMTQIDPGKKLVDGFPQHIDHIRGELSLAGRMRLDLPLDQVVTQWYESSGSADIALLSIKWGELQVDTNGTLSLDESLQPLAAFSAEIYGLDEILNKLESLGYIHQNLLPLLKTSLSFLRESKKGSEKTSKTLYHKIGVTLQDSDVLIGSIPILKLPAINWSKVGD